MIPPFFVFWRPINVGLPLRGPTISSQARKLPDREPAKDNSQSRTKLKFWSKNMTTKMLQARIKKLKASVPKNDPQALWICEWMPREESKGPETGASEPLQHPTALLLACSLPGREVHYAGQ